VALMDGKKMNKQKIAFLIEIGPDDWRVVARLLKRLLRTYGFLCLAIRPAKSQEGDKP
jgi:hypothetical protein